MYLNESSLGFYELPMPIGIQYAMAVLADAAQIPPSDEGSLRDLLTRLMLGLAGGNRKYRYHEIGLINIQMLGAIEDEKVKARNVEEEEMFRMLLFLLKPYLDRFNRADYTIRILDYRTDPSVAWDDLVTLVTYDALVVGPDMPGADRYIMFEKMTTYCYEYLTELFRLNTSRGAGVEKHMISYLQGLLYKVATEHPSGLELDEFDRSFLLHAISGREGYGPRHQIFYPQEYDGRNAYDVIDQLKKYVRGGDKFQYMSLATSGDIEQTVAFRGLTSQSVPFSTGWVLDAGPFKRTSFAEHAVLPWGAEHELRATVLQRKLLSTPPNAWYEAATGVKPDSMTGSAMASKSVQMAAIWEYSNLPASWKPIADVPNVKVKWVGPNTKDGYIQLYYYSDWRARWWDGQDVIDEIKFDQIMKGVLSAPGERLETTTPPMALVPPNAPLLHFTKTAFERIVDLEEENLKIPVYHTIAGEMASSAKSLDVGAYFRPYGNKLIRPSLSEYRTNTASDLFIERPELEQYALQMLGLSYLDRQLSMPMIRASINRWMFKLATTNDITFPPQISFQRFLRALLS
jgi:hypothetical protein